MGSDVVRRLVGRLTLVGCCLLTVAGGCGHTSGGPAAQRSPAPTASPSWNVTALRRAAPCLVVLQPGSQSSGPRLQAVGLDGAAQADLWHSAVTADAALLDCSPLGPEVALSQGPILSAGDDRDTLIVLRGDGRREAVAGATTTALPHIEGAALLGDGTLLFIRRLETSTGIVARFAACSSHAGVGLGPVRAVRLLGALPRYWFVADLVALHQGPTVALVLKTVWRPSWPYDFALVLADYSRGVLRVRTRPYYNETIYTATAAGLRDAVVFVHSRSAGGRQVTDIVSVSFRGSRPLARLLHADVGADPGTDVLPVCSLGPEKSVLFRTAPGPWGGLAGIDELDSIHGQVRETGVVSPLANDQWRWLGPAVGSK